MMRKIKLKICGLRSPENVAAVLSFRPDYIGFIFYKKSPRFVGEDHQWIHKLDSGKAAQKVGVFVNDPVERILAICRDTGIGIVQLHGQEKPEICGELMKNGLQVIKAFLVGDNFSFEEIVAYTAAVDFFLFDASGKYLGGNGIPFDWSLLENYPLQVPFFLSGGIGPENIMNVRFLSHPQLFAVDANSRLESGPGDKDPLLVQAFMNEFEKINYD
jgi:phosphoribosylanthranilate isomerase